MAEAWYVKAMWDAEAKVWVSESNVPGLVIEADTLAEFEQLLFVLAPEMLSANAGIHATHVAFEFTASARHELAVA